MNERFKYKKLSWIILAFIAICIWVLPTNCLQFASTTQIQALPKSQAFTKSSLTSSIPRSAQESTITIVPFIGIPLNCTQKSNDYCALYCIGDIGPHVNELLTEQQKLCGTSGLDLHLENCAFPNHSIMPHLFNGNFHLKILTITNCDLEYIAKNTFQQSAFVNLIGLSFSGNKIKELTAETFVGLRMLKTFKMENIGTAFTFDSFLQPLAKTLEILQIRQQSGFDQFDPQIWFGNSEFFQLLTVDLNGNYFPTILGNETFHELKSLENLSLQKCSIIYLEENTFETVAGTLQYLDLRNNNLKHLNMDFVTKISVHILELELAGNLWDCTCDNYEMILFVQQDMIEYTETILCASPQEWQNKSMNSLNISCTEETVEPTTDEETTTEEGPTTVEIVTGNPSTITSFLPSTRITTTWSTPSHTTFSTSERTTTNMPEETTTMPEETTKMPEETTTMPEETPNHVLIYCKRNNVNNPVLVHDFNTFFTIESVTQTSVNISIKSSKKHFTILYFNKDHSGRQNCDQNCLVANLKPLESYTFCLIPNEEKSISAFQCRSHKLNPQSEGTDLSSESLSNKGLFWTLFIFGILLCIIIGGGIVYFVLRWRPIWLRGNKRLVRASPTSQTVFLYSQPRKSREITERVYNEI